MAKLIKSIRGMHDVLPDDSFRWQAFETSIRQLMASYGYKEIRMPLVESTDLFCRVMSALSLAKMDGNLYLKNTRNLKEKLLREFYSQTYEGTTLLFHTT